MYGGEKYTQGVFTHFVIYLELSFVEKPEGNAHYWNNRLFTAVCLNPMELIYVSLVCIIEDWMNKYIFYFTFITLLFKTIMNWVLFSICPNQNLYARMIKGEKRSTDGATWKSWFL